MDIPWVHGCHDTRELIEKLLGLNEGPVVTITARLDPQMPGNDGDRIRLRNLLAEARGRVSLLDAPLQHVLVDRLDGLAARIRLPGGARGIVVVASPHFDEARLLTFPVGDGVSIGPIPAIRYLVQGLRRSPSYRILVISDRSTRLFEAVRDEGVEILKDGFPMSARIVPRDRRATSGRFALPPGRDDKEYWRKFYREVDAALTRASHGHARPLVVVGVRSSIGMFLETSQNTSFVIGTVEGAYDQLSSNALAKVVWPHMQDELERQRALAVEEISNARGTGGAVTGMDQVWQLAREGRGRRLVVEEGYNAEPSIEVDGHLEVADADAPDVIEDPVDEVIEQVIRTGGSVEFVADEALDDSGRIGLILR